MHLSVEEKSDRIRNLLDVISRRRPMVEAKSILAENLVCWMDGKKFGNGSQSWFNWVQFLQYSADKKFSGLEANIQNITSDDGALVVKATWQAHRNGEEQVSESGVVAYRFKEDKIVDIRTHKANYIFIYGPNFVRLVPFYWVLIKLSLWRPPPSSGLQD